MGRRRAVGTVDLQVRANTGGFVQDIDAAVRVTTDAIIRQQRELERGLNDFTRQIGREFNIFNRQIRGSIATVNAFVAAFVGSELLQYLGDSTERISELNNQARLLDIPIESLQVFQRAFRQVGVDADSTADAIQSAFDRIGSALEGGTGEIEDFQLLGISLQELASQSNEQRLLTIIDAIQQIDDVARRTAISLRIFGESESIISTIPAERIQQLREELERTGQLISQEQSQAVQNLNNEFINLGQSAQNAIDIGIANFAEGIQENEDTLQNFNNLLSDINVIILELTNAGSQLAQIFTQNVYPIMRRISDAFADAILQVRFGQTAAEIEEERRQVEDEIFANAPIVPVIEETIFEEPAPIEPIETEQDTQLQAALSTAQQVSLQEGLQLRMSLRTEQEVLNDELTRYNSLLEQGFIDQETYNRAVERANEEYQESIRQTSNLQGAFQEIQGALSTNLESWEDWASFILGTIDMVVNALSGQGGGLIDTLINSFSASQGVINTGSTQNLFGGFFQQGGNPPIGRFSIVGENGPELIFPRRSTTVFPIEFGTTQQGTESIVINQRFEAGVSQSQLREEGANIRRQTMQAVLDANRRGGNFRRGLRE